MLYCASVVCSERFTGRCGWTGAIRQSLASNRCEGEAQWPSFIAINVTGFRNARYKANLLCAFASVSANLNLLCLHFCLFLWLLIFQSCEKWLWHIQKTYSIWRKTQEWETADRSYDFQYSILGTRRRRRREKNWRNVKKKVSGDRICFLKGVASVLASKDVTNSLVTCAPGGIACTSLGEIKGEGALWIIRA